jgi:hypothetical protein
MADGLTAMFFIILPETGKIPHNSLSRVFGQITSIGGSG